MQVNIKSLEDVVRKYIGLAEQKTEQARTESHQVVIDVDDLEMPDTPERYIHLLVLLNLKAISRGQILDSSKVKEFADDNFKFDENGRKACFQGVSKGVIVWEWVNVQIID